MRMYGQKTAPTPRSQEYSTLSNRLVLVFSAVFCVFLLQDGTDAVVKDVLPGDSVHSLLSILDIITVRLYLHL